MGKLKNKTDTGAAGPRIICISSGKGGVGKTSISVNLAAAMAQAGQRVLLVDGDLGLANVDIVLGINAKHTMREVVEGGLPLNDVLVKIMPGFSVLPASSGVPEMASLAYEDQAYLTDALENIINDFDYVLLDTAAGIGDSVLWLNQWAAENYIIMSPDPTSMTDAYALIKVLHQKYDKSLFQLVINSVKSKREGHEVFASIAAVLNKFLQVSPELLGIIPQDNNVSQAIRFQKPFLLSTPDAKASKAIRQLSQAVFDS
ncbi:MAG: MinD/ParA family protein [Deltaproteobacteria bacterium]|nr:MinD/ParA family protein [Deltaproteobacteria bacterium]